MDILTHNKNFDAYTDLAKPNTGSNGGNTFLPEKPPKPEEQNFNTRLVFTTRTDKGHEPERHFLVTGKKTEMRLYYYVISVKPTATNTNLTLDDLDHTELH